ncbi:MAG: hypothetical protein U0165_00985 [Polyangiaceae bacterium]
MFSSKAQWAALSASFALAIFAVACSDDHKATPTPATSATATSSAAATSTASASASAASATTAAASGSGAASASASASGSAAPAGAVVPNFGPWKVTGSNYDGDDKKRMDKLFKGDWKKFVFQKCIDVDLAKDPASVSGVVAITIEFKNDGKIDKVSFKPEDGAKLSDDAKKCIENKLKGKEVPGDKGKLEFKVTFGPPDGK